MAVAKCAGKLSVRAPGGEFLRLRGEDMVIGRGVLRIAKERLEQIELHGFDAEHDASNKNGELADAAAYLLTGESDLFPGSWLESWQTKLDGKGHKERLIAAGALIAAEIDRLCAIESSGHSIYCDCTGGCGWIGVAVPDRPCPYCGYILEPSNEAPMGCD